MKKLSIFLLAALLISVFTACASDADTASETTTAADAAVTTAEPEPSYDFGGKTFCVYNTADDTLSPYWYYGADEQTGEVFNDAIYDRNKEVSEKFNVDLTFFHYNETDSVGANVSKMISESILAGDDDYQLIAVHMHQGAVALLNQGFLVNWLDVPNVNFDEPWYSQSINDNLTINGYLPAMISDFNITSQIFTFGLIFNKEMIADFGLESPYSIVKDGKWTMDFFADYIKVAAADVDGNGTFDENDSYGYSGNTGISMQGFFYGAGLKFVELDDENRPVIQLESEKYASFYDKVYSLYKDDNKTYLIKKVDDLCPIPLDSGRIMFISVRMRMLDQYRDVADFGIVPYPKWDEAQDNYYSYTDARGCMTMIPITNTDLEGTGFLVEELSRISYDSVVPIYRETILESKYARDEETLDMLSIIFDNRVFDFGYVYRTNPLTFATYSIFSSNSEPSSYIAKNIEAAQAHFDAVYESYVTHGK